MTIKQYLQWHMRHHAIPKMCEQIVGAFGEYTTYKGKHFTIKYDSLYPEYIVEYKGIYVARKKRGIWLVLRQGPWFSEFVVLYNRARYNCFGKMSEGN